MLTDIDYKAYVIGIPKGHRTPKSLAVSMTTRIDIPSLDSSDAPVAFRLASGGEVFETRAFAGKFYRKCDPARIAEATRPSRDGKVPRVVLEGLLDPGYDLRSVIGPVDLHARPDLKAFPMGWDAHSSVDARPIGKWHARAVDDTGLAAYETAAKNVAANFVRVDGWFWSRCFEPCLVVEWEENDDGGYDRIGDIRIRPGDTQALAQFVDGAHRDARGLRRMADHHRCHDVAGPWSPTRYRCFSLADALGLEEFVSRLSGDPHFEGQVIRDAAGYPTIELFLPEAASDDFEALELGRSARDLIGTCDLLWDILEGRDNHRDIKRALREAGRGTGFFETGIAELAEALLGFEEQGVDGAKGHVVEAMEGLAALLDDQARFLLREHGLDLRSIMYMPVPYCEIEANRHIDIFDIAGPRAGM